MTGRLVVGLVLVAIGVGLALDASGEINFGQFVGTYWPLILVAVGLIQLMTRTGQPLGPLILIGVGVFFLLHNLGFLGTRWAIYIGPALLVILGLVLLLPRRRHEMKAEGPRGPFRRVAFLGGVDERVHGVFEGGQVSTLMGGAKIDLRDALLPTGGATLEATATLGGIEILVPQDWQIQLDATPVLGGIENKTSRAKDAAGPTLRVKASALMGGIEIKN